MAITDEQSQCIVQGEDEFGRNDSRRTDRRPHIAKNWIIFFEVSKSLQRIS